MEDAARPSPEFDAVGIAKELLRGIRAGALATIDRAGGFPFASLVTVATDHDGSPLLLMSKLSAHTQNLEQDPRASILLAQRGKGDPLAHPRLTVIGRASRSTDDHVRRRFLARHPKAQLYAGFGDFSFWRLEIAAAHLNGGFARAMDLTAGQVRTNAPKAEWRATGLDPEGIDLAAGDRTVRVRFDRRVTGAGQLRKVLKEMADRARAQAV
jgi:putative heme iron utilization protein